jgi:AI-2 transport protein TqsA
MSSCGPNPKSPMHGLLVAACLVVIVAGLRAAEALLVPVVIAVFLAVLLGPLVRSLRRLRIPPFVGIPLVVLACVGVLGLIGGVVGQSVNSLMESAPRYHQRFLELTQSADAWLRGRGIALSEQRLMSILRPDTLLPLLGRTLSQVAAVLSHTVLVLILVVFLLFDALDLPERMTGAFSRSSVDASRWSRIADEVKEYLVLKTYLCLFTGAVTWIVLAATGIDFAPLWALVAVLLGYVPNIGPFIATAPPVLLALLQVGPGRMVIVLGLLSTVYLVIGNVIEPQVLGRRLGLSASVVFFALILWGWIWGPAGMLLSVPLMVVLKILLENSPNYGWLALLFEPASVTRDRAPERQHASSDESEPATKD